MPKKFYEIDRLSVAKIINYFVFAMMTKKKRFYNIDNSWLKMTRKFFQI